ncbi:MAG: dihydropteroate synthase [Azospirillaceae bacterium]|nr:dihydropteroate synthase [Azospirillaceae bacterium]
MSLAGSDRAFTQAEVIIRDQGQVHRAIASIPEIRAWARERGPAIAERVQAIMSRLTMPRPDFAGIDFDRPRIMGIVNCTPDSFSDGGCYRDPDRAIAHGEALWAQGAEILDIGGESTRPGAAEVPVAEEIARILPVVRHFAGKVRVSIDTRHAAVMRAALDAGADIINDVTGLSGDPDSGAVVAAAGAPVVLMHMRGEPQTMQRAPRYDDAALDVYDELADRVDAAVAAGIAPAALVVDPGIGFGKTAQHNIEILTQLTLFHGLGVAVLVGLSRKRFIGLLSRDEPADQRLAGSLAGGIAAWDQGAQILRVHDVAATAQARAIWLAINRQSPSPRPAGVEASV